MAGRKEQAYWDQAERLYTQENQTPEQIAEVLPVSATTLWKWKQKGGWEAKRRAALASPRTLGEKMRRVLEKQIENLEAEKGLNPAAYDAIYKAFCAIEKTERSHDLRVVAVEAMRAFAEFLKAQDLPAGELQLIGGRIRAWFRSLE